MLRAIFFDIDDTLYSTTRFAERARHNSIEAMITHGLKIEPDEGYRELLDVIAEFSSNYPAHYHKLLLRLPPAARKGTNLALLEAAAVVAYHETKFRELSAYEDVSEVMRYLAETDIILGVITAGLRMKQAEKLIRLGVSRFLHPSAIFITDEVGISKPNPKLFQRSCDALDLDPSTVMYVGDNPTHDIDPANAVGMVTVWNCREGKHLAEDGETRPDHVIANFWDLLEILQTSYGFDLGVEIR